MNQKKAKEDDVLEVFLYPKCCFILNPDEISEDLLKEEIQRYNDEINEFTNNFIWHRDNLSFQPRTKQVLLFDNSFDANSDEDETVPHIRAIMRFDEDIGDEWFAVFLIHRLTKKFDGLVARLVDSDGEFLLIEAADVLPNWANPQTCHNRVFLTNGAIHIVQDKQKKFVDALKGVFERPHFYKMSDKVQATLHKRLEVYPQEIERRKHKARAYLSDKAATILQQKPDLIAPAIRIICNSDAFERRVCRAMRHFPPEQRKMVNVKMTKCLYAMATHCRYTGDPRTGWNLPPTSSSKYKAHLLGIKIACGLEMLVARAHEDRRKKLKQTVEKGENAAAELEDKSWNSFVKRLESNGYFKDLIEGSKERERLVTVAREYFVKHFNLPVGLLDDEISEAEKVLQACENVQTNDDFQSTDVLSLSPADSDSWLNVDPAQLDAMLGQQYGPKGAMQQPVSLREKVQVFLNQKSDIDGVELFGEHQAESDEKPDTEDNGRMEFDSDMFDNALRDILDLVVPGADDEFEVSSEGSLDGDDDRDGEMAKYMNLLDSHLQTEMRDGNYVKSDSMDTIESNLTSSLEQEAGGSGPTGNIIGGPTRKLMHLQLQSPTTVPPDLQS